MDSSSSAVSPGRLIITAARRALPRIWWTVPATVGLAVVGFGLALIPPLLIRRIVDAHLATAAADGLWRLALLYLTAYLTASAAGFAQSYVTSVIGQHLLFEFRMITARHLSSLPVSFFGETRVGETISRVTSDVDTVSRLFTSGLVTALTDLFRIGGVLAGMYVISPPLMATSLVAMPLLYVVSGWFRRRMFEAEMTIRRSVGDLNAFVQETLSGLRLIKAFGRESDHAELFQAPLERNVQVSNRAAFYVAAFPCVTQLMRAAVIALVIWVGARTSVGDMLAISIGGLAAMVDLIGRLLDPVEAIANEVQVLQQALAGMRRLTELLSVPPEERGEAQRLEGTDWQSAGDAVALGGVSYGYAPGQPVVSQIDLRVPRGVKVALIGRTGAGKTTLMNLMAGLVAPWHGTVTLCGVNPHSLEPADRRRLVGIVPQTPVIMEGSVLDNVTLRDDRIGEEAVARACRLVGLHEQIESLPQGYSTPMGAGGAKLSYGQTQLLSIARAIVADPPVLLLDEPTAGMDTDLEEEIFRALRVASADRTIVTISHRVSGIIDAETVYVLANGRIVQSGAPSALSAERGWYAVFRELEELGWRMQ